MGSGVILKPSGTIKVSQLAVWNTDNALSFTVNINSDTGPGFTMFPGDKFGYRTRTGILSVKLTPVTSAANYTVLVG
jgi:hypothetical protein